VRRFNEGMTGLIIVMKRGTKILYGAIPQVLLLMKSILYIFSDKLELSELFFVMC
jgi:hypothetical protein